jgi:hypothetical protein
MMPVFKREQTDAEKARSKRGRSARTKGHNFEREIVNRLHEVIPDGYNACRMLQYRGGGSLPDVEIRSESGAIAHIECKKGKRPNIPKAFDQAFHDHKPGTIPIAVTRADRDHTLVTMRFQDWVDMLVPYLKGLEND